jgi:hypothetical protein
VNRVGHILSAAGCLAALALWLAASGGQAQTAPTPTGPGKGAGPRLGPITVVEVSLPDRASLDTLVRAGYDVARVQADLAIVYADGEELESLQAGGWVLALVPSASAPGETGTPKALGSYNNYANMTAMLDGYATNYPALCRKFSLGKSVQTRDLWAMKITSQPDLPQDKPQVKYLSTIHGNEPLGTELCLYLLDILLKGYASNDTRIVNLVNNVEIWLVPLLNPDGRENSLPERYNANGYDLNRSFPEGSTPNLGNWLYGPALNTNGLQPEVREVAAWTAAHNFILGANFHTGSLVVNYPYDDDGLGSTFSPSPDEALFRALSRTYSSNNPPMWANTDPANNFTNGIVNGADWYSISGGLQDWSYRYAGVLDVTIELANYQWPDPPANLLPTYWSQNRESMLSYLEWSLRGVRGLIRNAQTGQPVTAAVRVEDIHHLVFSSPGVGDYHRVLLPGTYTLWFYAPGYVPQRIPNVTVGSGAATRLDVALQPVSPRFAAKINFQPASAVVPVGFVADSGAVFGPRGNGYNYGWETTLASANLIQRQSGRSQDLRYDTACQMLASGSHTWELALPNGPYSVLVCAGDPLASSGLCRVQAENVLLLDGSLTADRHWLEGLGTVVVTDGRLTVSSAAGATANALAFLEVSALEPVTIQQWRAVYFGTTNNTGLAADQTDPDHDGITNLLEYAFGLNPTNTDSGPLLSGRVVHTNQTDWFVCSFGRNTNATDLTFTVQAAATLPPPTWLTLASCTNGLGWSGPGVAWETPASPGRALVTVLDTQPITAATNRFFRLRVN